MNKLLLGSSAIALLAATPAAAVEWNVRVGGFMNMHVAYGNTDIDTAPDADLNGVDVLNNSEIIFSPSITLDNGITFGGQVQLEAQSSGDQIDESFAIIRGSFGEINIGDENSAGYKMTYAAPNVTAMPINSGSVSAFVPFSGAGGVTGLGDIFRNAKGSSFIEVGRNNDAARITYYTPRFAGFQVGASYARDPNQDDNSQVDLDGAAIGDIFDVGANYLNSFGGFDIGLSGRYGTATDDRASVPGTDIGENPEVYAFGANLGFAGFTLGYAFAETNNSGNDDSQGHSGGISYETGPWGLSAEVYYGTGVDAENEFAVTDNKEEFLAVHVGGAYQLASGVGLSLYGVYVDADEDRSDDGSLGGDDIDGFIIGTAVSLSF